MNHRSQKMIRVRSQRRRRSVKERNVTVHQVNRAATLQIAVILVVSHQTTRRPQVVSLVTISSSSDEYFMKYVSYNNQTQIREQRKRKRRDMRSHYHR